MNCLTMHELRFHVEAAREYNQLQKAIRLKLHSKLLERLSQPDVPSARLSGELAGCFKIKLVREGVRLVYRVNQSAVTMTVISVGKRADAAAYVVVAKPL